MTAFDKTSCNKNGCEKTWERDPIIEVGCPQCGADPGVKCKRPSGHDAWDQGNALPKGVHKIRDMQALKEGAYGKCPLGRCPNSLEELDRSLTSTERKRLGVEPEVAGETNE